MRRRPHYIKLTLQGECAEARPGLPFFTPRAGFVLPELLQLLRAASSNNRVKAVFFVIKDIRIGWGGIQEIHQELDRFHQAGKRSFVYLEHVDNRTYYLACGAKSLAVAPAATVDLVGLRAEMFFLKNLLEHLGVQPQLFKLGDYKSAGEIFTRESMSESSRLALDSILSDLQSQYIEKVAAQRNTSTQQVQKWVDQGPYNAIQASEIGLIDTVCYESEVEKRVKREVGGLRELPIAKLRPREGFFKRLLTFYRPQIGYLVADGMLDTGPSRHRPGQRSMLGAETLIQFLDDARKRRRIKAIVIRVNSPGGSALASDLVWHQIQIVSQKKPIIFTFGDIAASGGYYLSAGGQSVLAMPATLTGSIGVIQGKFSFQGLLSKIGIQVDSLDKGRHAGYSSSTRPFSQEESAIVKHQMREFYENSFLKKVAEGRGKTVEEVRKVAEGRVWTGAQAKALGLIDQTGGILDALQLAQEKAGIHKGRKVRIVQFARRRKLKDLLAPNLPSGPFGDNGLTLLADELEIY